MTLRTSPVALAALAARAAGSVSGVIGVAPEVRGAATTYGPGASFAGVAVRPGRSADVPSTASLHLVLRSGATIPEGSDAVRAEVARTLDDADPDHAPWTINVHIAALDTDPDPAPAAPVRRLA